MAIERFSRKEELLARSIHPESVRITGPLTTPRSFGVYRLVGNKGTGRLYRYGNHPIRRIELVRDFGGAELVALFIQRHLAVELARLLNGGTSDGATSIATACEQVLLADLIVVRGQTT